MNKSIVKKSSNKERKSGKKSFCFALMIFLVMSAVHSPAVLSQVNNSNSVEDAQEKTTAVAADKTEKKKRVYRAQTMRQRMFEKLDKVRELTDAKEYSAAASNLESIGKIRRNSYETAMTWNMHAYMHFNQENYSAAAEAYEKIIVGKRIPESLLQTTLYSLAKLYLIQQDYKSALVNLNKWFDKNYV
jgi:tetratricopeptide (TPR) repeat protein